MSLKGLLLECGNGGKVRDTASLQGHLSHGFLQAPPGVLQNLALATAIVLLYLTCVLL